VTSFPATLTSTPDGMAMGAFPIRDMSVHIHISTTRKRNYQT
jgi:hypothetical protein